MAKETIKVLQIDTNPAVKSLKDLRNELKQYKDQMANLEEGSDAFLEVANKAGELKHQIDEINESIKGASADFGDMVGNVTNVMAGITGAFQAVAGGLQAMGVESKAIDETIVKMQGLMAVTQGLSAIDDGIKSFDKLTKSLGKAGESLNSFVKGLGKLAAPVAIVTALGVAFVKLKESIDGTSTALKERETAQKNFNTELERELLIRQKAGYTEEENIQFEIAQLELRNEALRESNETLQAQNDLVSQNAQAAQSAAATMGGLVASHAAYDAVAQSENINVGANTKIIQQNTKEIDENAEAIKKLKDELDIINEARKLASERTKNSTKSDTEAIENNIETIKNSASNAINSIRNVYQSVFNSLARENNDITIALQDIENQINKIQSDYNTQIIQVADNHSLISWSKKEKKSLEEQRAELEQILILRNQEINLHSQRKKVLEGQINTETAIIEGWKNTYDEMIAKYNELALSGDKKAAIDFINAPDVKAIITEYENGLQKIQDLNIQLNNESAVITELGYAYAELSSNINKIVDEIIDAEKWEIFDKNIRVANEQFEILKKTTELFSESTMGISSHWVNAINDIQGAFNILTTTIREGGEDSWKGYVNAAAAGLQSVGTILNSLSDDMEVNNEASFEEQKKLQIGATIMNMLSGIMAAWTSAMALPTPWNFIQGGIATAATSALGGIQINKIKNTKYDGNTSVASTSTPAVNSMIIPPVQYSSAVQGASTEGAIKDTKVYVTETDIKDTMSKVDVQESENTY